MTERSWFWGGKTIGDAPATSYTDDDFSDVWAKLLTYDRKTQCVVYTERVGYTGLLEVTKVDDSNVAVDTGIGFIDGKSYDNDASKNLAVGGNGFYRVVLRKTWATQLVRLAILGPQAVVPPSVTQTDGTLWEVDLATFEKAAGVIGAITNTSYRVGFAAQVDDSTLENVSGIVQVKDAGITPAKLLDRTRKFLVSPYTGYDTTTPSDLIRDGAIMPGAGLQLADAVFSRVTGSFIVPQDFVTGSMIVKVVLVPDATGNVYANATYSYGQCGEDWTTHSNVLASAAHSVTDDLYCCVMSVSLASAHAGDIVRCYFVRDATDVLDTVNNIVHIVGWLVEYTADS